MNKLVIPLLVLMVINQAQAQNEARTRASAVGVVSRTSWLSQTPDWLPPQIGDSSSYRFNLINQRYQQCRLEVKVGNIGVYRTLVQSPNYEVIFRLRPEQRENHKLHILGVEGRDLSEGKLRPACNADSHIYLNDVILDEWSKLKSRLELDGMSKCVSESVAHLGGNIDGEPSNGKLLTSISDAFRMNIFRNCGKLNQLNLRTNFDCQLPELKEMTKCDEKYVRRGTMQPLSLQQAIAVQYENEEVVKGLFETSEAASSRQKKLAEALAKKELEERLKREEEERKRAAEQRRIEEERKRQEWLTSPEGKKFIAEQDEKRAREQAEQAKADAIERERIEKEFPYYALITCGMGGGKHLARTISCFLDDGSLEVRNGAQYGRYNVSSIASGSVPNTKEGSEGLLINLRSNFSVIAINGYGTSLVLGVKIFNRKSREVLFQKEVGKLGVISVKN